MHAYRLQHRISHADVDFLGELKLAALLGLLEQAAVEASTEVGFDAAWYSREGRIWIIRRTRIERSRPVGGGDLIEVATRVADYRRARSLRRYAVSRQTSGETERVATATTDWVYCDLATGRPASIPEGMQRAFSGPEPAPSLPRAERLPAAGSGAAVDLDLIVRPSDLDHVVHVNNAVYGSFLEDGGFALFAALGWPLERMLAAGGALRVRRLDAEYLADATAGDGLTVHSWLEGEDDLEAASQEAPARAKLVQSITRRSGAGGEVMRARSEWRWLARPRVVGGVPD
ncbi:MAG TPA: thioesterase family protein [Candidatus Bathyarchaeia archaeon]|nr:thioesterase family protein [Candidatus Bathyarchaeia archaeon]